jgi:hypothetical protein
MSLRQFLGLAILASTALAQSPKTKNIILVTSDGLRWQDFLNGIDPLLMNEKAAGMDPAKKEAQVLREQLNKPGARERREALMPFFWKQLAPKGVVLGNVQVTNSFRVSYPGYSEILTGRAQDERIKGNDKIQNPTPTVLEHLKSKLKLPTNKVALFSSWETFSWIGEHTPGNLVINAGYKTWDGPARAPRLIELSRAQFEMLTPWDGSRHDLITFEMALAYLQAVKPSLLYMAFDETDDWAHDKRYDRVLASIQNFDRWLERLWQTIESLPEYRGSTTLIVTSDHGRGSTLEDWGSHGAKVVGADRIWAFVIGPDTPSRGEVTERAAQRDIAPTMIRLMGFDPKEYTGVLGTPIAAALR